MTLAEANLNLINLAKWIPLLPVVALLINGIVLGAIKPARKLAALVTILAVGGSFALSVCVWLGMGNPAEFHATVVKGFEWINIGNFHADFNFFIDPLTVVMLLVVTGVGTLIAIYASGYMAGDPGYYRFFAYIGLFIFAMTVLVMGDNLLLLFLGWEGVGLSSYLLIGFYYRKPSAAAAAKKAFIVNRVGDFGFALGLMGIFLVFGGVAYQDVLPTAELSRQVATSNGDAVHFETPIQISHNDVAVSLTDARASIWRELPGDKSQYRLEGTMSVGGHADTPLAMDLVFDRGNARDPQQSDVVLGDHSVSYETFGRITQMNVGWQHTLLLAIPFLLMLGAFGKSAQLPLHVWLPDAMEGPTPVSALIHAATMVTAGVYMIARLLPIFQLSEYALYTVAIVGGITALFAATIALCQYDIKRVWAYSTISQLGYMFLGVGVLSTVGGVFHLFTHAFFKALLFLTAGSVMHALAGQLDMRNMSGMIRKMPITAILMLIGCLALAGFPFTAGYYSKDMILAAALDAHPWLGWMGIGTALLTAFYTFRLWFKVFMGPTEYVMSNEHHGYPSDHPHDDHEGDHHGPHEMPWLMNGPLVLLAVGALALGFVAHEWMGDMVNHSTAATGATHLSGSHQPAHGDGGMDTHTLVSLVTGVGGVVMILLAGYFFWINRKATEKIAAACKPIVTFLNNKWYIDELYHYVIVMPLRIVAWICYLFDRLIIDGLIMDGLLRYTPRVAAEAQSPLARGMLQGFALAMAVGVILVLAIVVYATVL